MTALCNSIWLICEAISRFDIMAIDTQRLAAAAQLIADTGRIIYNAVNILIVIFGR